MAKDIFISYRRSDGISYAKLLHDKLSDKGYTVYYDIETSEQGFYDDNLKEAIKDCTDFVVLLTNDALGERIHDPSDIFRQEIICAKEHGKRFIGVMIPPFKEFSMKLPEKIEFLPRVQCLKLDFEFFDAFLDKLTSSAYLASIPRNRANSKNSQLPEESEDNDLFRDPRFLRQSNLYYQVDMQAINEVMNNFQRKGLTVLDLGCGDCEVSCTRFAGIAAISKVICVDSDSLQVKEGRVRVAKDPHKKKFTVVQLDLKKEDFIQELRTVLRECGVRKVDIVFSALTFHFLPNPESLLSHIRTVMADDGYFILRELDDDTKVYYAQGDRKTVWMRKVVESYQQVVSHYTDRNCARKMFSWLTLQGFSDVRLFYDQIDTCGKTKREREDIFHIMVGFRKARAEKKLKTETINEETKCLLNEVIQASDELKDLFLEDDFWFFCTNYVAIARKQPKQKSEPAIQVPIELYLIRHAQCDIVKNGEKLVHEISEEGRREIAALSKRMAGVKFDTVICSTMQRAVETAAPIAESHQLSLEQYPELNEIDRGDILTDAIWAENESYYRRWKKHETDLPFPSGENGINVWLRAKFAIDRIRENAEKSPVQDRPYRACVVTHGGTIRAIICGLLGIPERMRYQFAWDLHSCSTSIIRICADSSDNVNTDNAATLELFNDNSYLRDPQ